MIKVEHILEKGSGRFNEDRLVIGENIFGVFDGASSLAAPPAAVTCGTGGSLAATIARGTFAGNHFALTRLGRSANSAILERMVQSGVRLNRPEQIWSTSAAVVRLHPGEVEWFQTGDAQILLLYGDGSHKILADRPDHDYDTLVMLKNARDKSLSNPVLKRQVQNVRAGMNKRYGVLNGDPGALDFAKYGRESLAGVEALLIFTDGLSLPCPDPAPRKDFTALAGDYRQLGLKGLHKKIRAIEKRDPGREKFPRFKCHDDIAAISVSLA